MKHFSAMQCEAFRVISSDETARVINKAIQDAFTEGEIHAMEQAAQRISEFYYDHGIDESRSMWQRLLLAIRAAR